jgi:hypothetical protein
MMGNPFDGVIKIKDRVSGERRHSFTVTISSATGVHGYNYYSKSLIRNKKSITQTDA